MPTVALTPEKLAGLVDDMFKKQGRVLSMWQILADNFYPERADFRYSGTMSGLQLADATVDSYPVVARRDLGNSFHSMLRDGEWFHIAAGGGYEPDHDGKEWLQAATHRQRAEMGSRRSNFTRSVKQGDMDFATFGNAVISIEPNWRNRSVVYRNWHLRDCAWQEDETGQVETVARRWEPTLHQFVRTFGEDKLPRSLKKRFEKNPFDTCNVTHVCMPSELYGKEQFMNRPYVSVFLHRGDKTIIEEVGLSYKYYVVPRFQTVAGSPYAFSPATITALPDARTLQAMTFTLLEAAERYARPPLVAQSSVLTGVVDLSPDGITYVDSQYDERLGDSLKPLQQDKGGFPIGQSERGRVYETLQRTFFLDTLNLPLGDKEMTAYEVQERMKQYRRQNLPLFAPMEDDYNGQICETTFDLMFQMGMFGSVQDIPRSLQGQDVQFKYKSPLTADEEEQKINRVARARDEIAAAAQLDAGVIDLLDFDTAFRDALGGLVPAQYMRPMDEIAEIRQTRLAKEAAMAAAQAQAGGAQ